MGGADESDLSAALADPDRQLGVTLEATVAAFEADPTEPLHFAPMQQVDLVHHAQWPLSPDAVKAHDLQQLIDLFLVSSAPAAETAPCGRRRTDGLPFMMPLVSLSDARTPPWNDKEASRLRRWVRLALATLRSEQRAA